MINGSDAVEDSKTKLLPLRVMLAHRRLLVARRPPVQAQRVESEEGEDWRKTSYND